MNYKILANKWRPKTFNDVVGQEHVIKALINSINSGKIHHTYLLSGTRGIGKTTIARLLNKSLNCENGITINPCNKCINCHEINHDKFIDFIEIDAASKTKVEDIKEIIDNIEYTTSRGRFKIYLIDEVHMLSKYSFNALLKTLEEPPSHVKFILATTNPNKIPNTILSRCLQFYLNAFNPIQIYKQIEKILKLENIKAESLAIKLIAKNANGSMRDALNITDQAIAINKKKIKVDTIQIMLGLININQPLTLLEILIKANSEMLLLQLNKYNLNGVQYKNIIIEMLSLLHHIAIKKITNNTKTKKPNRLQKLISEFSLKEIHFFYKILIKGNKELKYAKNYKMGVEMILLRIITFHPRNKNNK